MIKVTGMGLFPFCRWQVDQSAADGFKLVDFYGDTLGCFWKKDTHWSSQLGRSDSAEEMAEAIVKRMTDTVLKQHQALGLTMQNRARLGNWNAAPNIVLRLHEKLAIEAIVNAKIAQTLRQLKRTMSRDKYGFGGLIENQWVTVKAFRLRYSARDNACVINKTQYIELALTDGGSNRTITIELGGLDEHHIQTAINQALEKTQ